MGILRTIVFSVLSLLSAGTALASDTPLHTFASCAGRLSAVMEHQWLMRDPASEQTDAAWALRRAEAELAACTGLLLS